MPSVSAVRSVTRFSTERNTSMSTPVGANRRIENGLEFGFVDRLTVVFVQHRLRIERFEVARAADHEEPDDSFGARREVNWIDRVM